MDGFDILEIVGAIIIGGPIYLVTAAFIIVNTYHVFTLTPVLKEIIGIEYIFIIGGLGLMFIVLFGYVQLQDWAIKELKNQIKQRGKAA